MQMIDDINVWWPQLPESVRAVLSASPDAELSRGSILALVQARGFGPAAAYWLDSGSETARFTLTDDEQKWIRALGERG